MASDVVFVIGISQSGLASFASRSHAAAERQDTPLCAVASARFAAALAALVCVPLAVISGEIGNSVTTLGILGAALPSVVALSVLNRSDVNGALNAAAISLAVIAASAAVAGVATIGFAFLAVAGLIEAAMQGQSGKRLVVAGGSAITLAAGLSALFFNPVAALSAEHLRSIIWICLIVASVHGSVSLAYAASRMAGSEAAAARDLARLHAMLANLEDVTLVTDRSGRVLDAGENCRAALSLAPSDLAGRGLIERVNVPDRPLLLKAILDALLDSRDYRIVLRLRVSGEDRAPLYRDVQCRILPAGDDECVHLILRDVTETQEEIEALRNADSLRRAATKNRGLFVSGLSHEVRTPLNAIIGFSEMLSNPSMGPLPPDTVREYAGIVHDSGQRLFRLVTATIDLFRLDSGTYEINTEPFALAPLIDQATDAVAEEADAKDIGIVRDVPPFMSDIVSDRRALREVLGHVLSNAVKFAPAGSTVSVSVETNDRQVALTIVDRGPGIAPELVSQICDPFFQADGSYDRTVAGAGLGLALVKRLVEVLGGDLKIDSRPDAGTSVRVTLPLEARPSEAPLARLPERRTIKDETRPLKLSA